MVAFKTDKIHYRVNNSGRAVSELVPIRNEKSTPAEFSELADIPLSSNGSPTSPTKKQRADKIDVQEFVDFSGLREPAALRTVARSHVIAWRKNLESRELEPSSIRRKLSAIPSLFEYLCERNAVASNPVNAVRRPMANNNN